MRNHILGGGLHDPDLNFTFEVWAYRRVTDAELKQAYAFWRRKNKAKRNQTVKVMTVIGSNE